MTKVKLSITNRWTGAIIFEYEKENNTMAETVKEYIRQEIDKNKSRADLTRADLTDANLTHADLTDADLTRADLTEFKNDLWCKLLIMKHEILAFKEKIKEGKINGTAYEGACACFIGTIANIQQKKYNNLAVKADSDSPVERWFLQFKEGQTPENSAAMKITLDWVEELEMYLSA
jgi:hypothetical protein